MGVIDGLEVFGRAELRIPGAIGFEPNQQMMYGSSDHELGTRERERRIERGQIEVIADVQLITFDGPIGRYATDGGAR